MTEGTTMTAEREAIVQYLRECQAIHESRLESGKHKTASKHHADACKYAAIAIERGDHLKESTHE